MNVPVFIDIYSVIDNKEMDSEIVAQLLFKAELKRQIQNVRKEYFSIIDGLKTDDKDNFAQLCTLLNDEDLARKFMLFHENRSQKIRKDILDSTNNMERILVELLENIEMNLKQGVELQSLIK